MDNKDLDIVWEIFSNVSKQLDASDKKRNGGESWDRYGGEDDYRLGFLNPRIKHDSEKAKSVFRVLPLIDGEVAPTVGDARFEKCAVPTKKYNAVAFIDIGHTFDQFDNSKRGGEDERRESAKKNILPKFLEELNSILKTQKIDGRSLKAEIVNGDGCGTTYVSDNGDYIYGDLEKGSYGHFFMPVALKVTFA